MHKPVLLEEVLNYAKEISPAHILDGTFGRGGHSRAMLEAIPNAHLTGIDQDLAAVAHAEKEFAADIASNRFAIKHFNFHNIANFENPPGKGFDVILLDLGVSSPQLDEADRGFSFYNDGPLDMRMDQTLKATAADVINTWPEVELNDLFIKYGEIRRPQRVVRALVNDRKTKPFTTTRELASLIERVEGWTRKGHHPATRFFLALRMEVNNELSGLEACIPDLLRALSPTGRLIVITFHSLEDRIIKYAFKESVDMGRPLFKKVVVPSREEERDNPALAAQSLEFFSEGATMIRRNLNEILPFFSVLILVATLFSMVLLKMEVRRMGYATLKATQEYRALRDRYRLMSMEYAQLTRPELVRKYAVSRLTLNDARNGQIIQLAGSELAMPQ